MHHVPLSHQYRAYPQMIKQQDSANQLLRQPRLQQTMLGARLQPSWHRVQYIRSEQGGSADGPTAPKASLPPEKRCCNVWRPLTAEATTGADRRERSATMCALKSRSEYSPFNPFAMSGTAAARSGDSCRVSSTRIVVSLILAGSHRRYNITSVDRGGGVSRVPSRTGSAGYCMCVWA